MKVFTVFGKKHLLLAALAFFGVVAVLTATAGILPTVVAQTAATERKLPVYCTDRDGKQVAFTFDAAWGNEDTGTLIDIFKQNDIHVTFFVVGEWCDRCSDSVKALAAAGHEVMNHSSSHPHMPALSRAEMQAEIRSCNEKIAALTGKTPTLFRAPYGDYDNALLETLDGLGMQCVQWDVDSLDWKDLSAGEITERVLSKVQSGSIVLFHNAAKHTPEALPGIIKTLKAQGYTFVKASELLYPAGTPINHEGRQLGAASSTAPT